MTQNNKFSFDSAVYPPATGTGNTTLLDLDPVNQKILSFYRGILQANLGARWNEASIAAGIRTTNLPNTIDGYIVGDAICYPPPSTLKQTDYKFPLLSSYRNKETYRQMSTNHILTESDFQITWTLPPLNTPNQLNLLYPFLSAVSKTILFYTFNGSDPKYNNGELVWQEAGFAFALMDKAEVGSFLGQDGKTIFPSVQIGLKIFEKNQFVPENYEPFTGFDVYISEVDGYNINNPLDFIQFSTNPNLAVNSFSPTSGSINGNTLVVIHGQGFEAANISQQSQIKIANNSVSSFLVKSDTTIIAITGYTTATTSGNIVITDNLGNIATSPHSFSYT